MEIKAIYNNAEPYKFVNRLLNTKPKLSAAAVTERVKIDIDECQEKVFFLVIGGENGDNFDHNHGKDIKHEHIFMFEKLKNCCFASRSIDLMRVD